MAPSCPHCHRAGLLTDPLCPILTEPCRPVEGAEDLTKKRKTHPGSQTGLDVQVSYFRLHESHMAAPFKP